MTFKNLTKMHNTYKGFTEILWTSSSLYSHISISLWCSIHGKLATFLLKAASRSLITLWNYSKKLKADFYLKLSPVRKHSSQHYLQDVKSRVPRVSWFIWTALYNMYCCTSSWTDFWKRLLVKYTTKDKKPFCKVLKRSLVFRGSILKKSAGCYIL